MILGLVNDPAVIGDLAAGAHAVRKAHSPKLRRWAEQLRGRAPIPGITITLGCVPIVRGRLRRCGVAVICGGYLCPSKPAGNRQEQQETNRAPFHNPSAKHCPACPSYALKSLRKGLEEGLGD